MNILLDILFPKSCVGCSKKGSYLCSQCIKTIPIAPLLCSNCETPSAQGITHQRCFDPWGLDGLWVIGEYSFPLKVAIGKLKYQWVTELAQILVTLISFEVTKEWVVVPVPLHPKRLRWRGFNQTALLGEMLSKQAGCHYAEPLVKVKNTHPQMELSGKERRSNIQGAFIVKSASVSNKNILLVDDVWTTGSTMKECCRVLKQNGAKRVWGITLAR